MDIIKCKRPSELQLRGVKTKHVQKFNHQGSVLNHDETRDSEIKWWIATAKYAFEILSRDFYFYFLETRFIYKQTKFTELLCNTNHRICQSILAKFRPVK